ncbi:major facilitator superfamily transporter multidrug resistance [Colletotrichum kahawae]|uniref:Major facilitator superfamily transporter multidrug resistance n=1 Tax=Colletotrichum kahawae TaxID=34407 RepID=A0AAD9YJB0_COLKA|nr:major facilitator superfamily transporter multidrug resistance [Colletotrichum kahawae]
MAYAVAIIEARDLPRPRSSEDAGKAMSMLLCQVAHDPDHILAQFTTLSFGSLMRIKATQKTVLSLANEMAGEAWGVLRNVDGVVLEDLVLSGREQQRFTKAIYETELLSVVFGDESWGTDDMDVYFGADGDIYLSYKTAWEVEAIGCVLDFFEKRLFEVSLDVFTHDVEFGWFSFDYLRRGRDNEDVMTLALNEVSGGVKFIHQLIHESSYEARRDLLWATNSEENSVPVGSVLEGFSQSRLRQPRSQQLALYYGEVYPQAGEDLDDKGPQMAFDQTLLGQTPFYHPIYAGQRERGYVFWDANRLMADNHKLLNFIKRTLPTTNQTRHIMSSGPIYLDHTPATISAMEESWDERAAIFEEGGRGFWNDGDYNRIE